MVPTIQTMPPKIICIDANIGAGKSTLLKRLAARGKKVIMEGVDNGAWGAFLPRFYKNPARWAFSLQMAIALDMARQHVKKISLFLEGIFVWLTINCSPPIFLFLTANVKDAAGHTTH